MMLVPTIIVAVLTDVPPHLLFVTIITHVLKMNVITLTDATLKKLIAMIMTPVLMTTAASNPDATITQPTATIIMLAPLIPAILMKDVSIPL
jgi:hypothetical protein